MMIYILELEEGRFYVGKTTDLCRRVAAHLQGTIAWTRMYRPLRLVDVIYDASHFDEDKFVKEYMALHGIDNVRGGAYSRPTLSPEEVRFLQREIWAAHDKCIGCGASTHFIRHCDTSSKRCAL